MRFAHMADLHIGGWSNPKLTELGLETFRLAISKCISERLDFVLFSGDLFNTALPQIEYIKEVVVQLKKLKDFGISSYIIPGSHDFSPSGKTMLDVFEKAGLVKNVVKFNDNKLVFTIDEKTNTKITGLFGKKGGLEKLDYETLEKKELEDETGFKIFMFHTALEELKSKDLENMESMSTASLPKNFNYYAGGHVHYILEKDFGNGKIVFPGALFPNNFKELEEYLHGGFYIVDSMLNLSYVPIKVKETIALKFDATDKTPYELHEEILSTISELNYHDKIILLRIFGTLKSGKPSDINFNKLFNQLNDAYCIIKNISKLSTKEFKKIKAKEGSMNEIENSLIEDYVKMSENSLEDFKLNLESFIPDLMKSLSIEKNESEKNKDYEKRVLLETLNVLKI